MINRHHRADLEAARNIILSALWGADDADLEGAAAMLDRVLKETCPHKPETWETRPSATCGLDLTTCYECPASWFEHGDAGAAALAAKNARQTERRRVYMSALVARLEERAREHGHAYVTPPEGAWLTANGLRQPGHTRYRYSTPGEV